MSTKSALLLIAFTIIGAFSCPDNCKTCDADVTKCEQCSSGYQLDEATHLCVFTYASQSEWSGICTTGTKQSPINIDPYHESLCPSGAQFYQTTKTIQTTISPAGENLKASFVDQSTVTYVHDSTTSTFSSIQFHWHHPSEHQVDGKNYDLELHIVHNSTDGTGTLAVTGLLFEVDSAMSSDILDKYNFFADNSSHPFSFPIFLKNKMVYHYEGSLTTPPCTEGVQWFVYTEHFPITEHNFERIKELINENRSNSRSTQNLNNRTPQMIGGFCNPWHS